MIARFTLRSGFAAAVAGVGVLINGLYGAELSATLLNPATERVVREISISAVSLEFGWAALLVWVAFRPTERRGILLFTAISMLLANTLHGVFQLDSAGVAALAVNMAFGFIFAGLFVAAYVAAGPTQSAHIV